MPSLPPITSFNPARCETTPILKRLASSGRCLAELKGVAATIPNQSILINTLTLQEAKDSSEIENIITIHDDLFKGEACSGITNPTAKEVLRYRQALWLGLERVRATGLLTANHIQEIQAELEQNSAGFRKLPGTVLKDSAGRTVYSPPQDPTEITALMRNLENFINAPGPDHANLDPLIRMALIHHQFERIHPFYDGNGRTGRILNVLYLVKEGLLEIPVLYLSRFIVEHKADYYRLLQETRTQDHWEEWILFMLEAVEITAKQTLHTVQAIRTTLMDFKHRIRAGFKFYSQYLINNLFNHPYTKIEFLARDLGVSRPTASKYLDALATGGFLRKEKIWRETFYLNQSLMDILSGTSLANIRNTTETKEDSNAKHLFNPNQTEER